MNYFIITGTSKGLGQAIAEKLMTENNILFCISRSENKVLIEKAQDKNIELHYIQQDLNDVHALSELMESIFTLIKEDQAEGIYLVNNAGIVTPIKPAEKCEAHEIAQNINVNLVAPMTLTAEFIKNTEGLAIEKRILNISSGAGKNPYYGWSSYCSAKAGLDLFTKTVGLEESSKDNPVKIIAVSPGIIDTDMQGEIRDSKEEDFVQVKRFTEFKEKGMLSHPDTVAEALVKLLYSPHYEQGGVIGLNEIK